MILGVNTQTVKSFHNSLKYEIKKKKSVFAKDRALFFSNNEEDAFEIGLNLIKLGD
ncbi:hypothetical protein H311_00280 [Anncaliia algerae PRA109]|nr:hypothetical protein H311_00280 [Anncaliia algerae PRA109]